MAGLLDILMSANLWGAALRIATPLMFGVLGALLCERAGVLNLGIEGIFTAGALALLGSGLTISMLHSCGEWVSVTSARSRWRKEPPDVGRLR